MVGGVSTVIGFVVGVPGKILEALGSLYDDAFHIASRLIDGLIDGIKDGVGDVVNAVKGIGGDIKSAFSSVLSIFSPSKVFYGYGQNLMEGLAGGIEEISHLPTGAVGQVAAALAATSMKASAFATTSTNVAEGPGPGPGPGPAVGGVAGGAAAAGPTINVYVTVQGNVATEKELGDAIYQQLLRQGTVNGSAGQLFQVGA